MSERVLILGGTSAIALAMAQRYAQQGAQLFLVGRDEAKLAAASESLQAAGAAEVSCATQDLAELPALPATIDQAFEQFGGIDVAIIAHGLLPDQARCEESWQYSVDSMTINLLSPLVLLTHLGNRLAAVGAGQIIIIGSVAGDRGRKTNYVYGTAKGALERLAEGLRNRMHEHDVNVLLVKPGFVDTPMTATLDKNFLFAQPDKVAKSIEKAARKRRQIIYVPGFWRLIMLVIRSIPETVFKRMSL